MQFLKQWFCSHRYIRIGWGKQCLDCHKVEVPNEE